MGGRHLALPPRLKAPRLPALRLDSLFKTDRLVFYSCAAVLVASLLLGGGTRAGFLSDAILQLVSLPLLLLGVWTLFDAKLTRQIRFALVFCAMIVALPLLQLVPLPPWLWTALPYRHASTVAFELTGHPFSWMPISVSPETTWLSLLSLVPPLAVFVGVLLLSYRQRRRLSLILLAVGVVSAFLGLIQVAQGQESPLRFYAITNPTEAVGFFANRNHFAAFNYALVVFAVAWMVHAAGQFGAGFKPNRYDFTAIAGTVGGFTLLVIFLAAETIARSRAGLGLTMVALIGGLALGLLTPAAAQPTTSGASWLGAKNRLLEITPARLLIAAIALTLMFSLQYALFRIRERFDVSAIEDARRIFIPNTIAAARAYMPFGSGMGTFTWVYPLFEKPQDTMVDTYVNHAHNDVVERWLETGLPGLLLMGVFLFWFVSRSLSLWRNTPAPGASDLDWSLARAATIVIGLLIAHSAVDYPIRTGAMMAVMAFACALLIEPLPAKHETRQTAIAVTPEPPLRRKEQRPEPALPKPRPPETPADNAGRNQAQRWGTDIDWPQEWSKPADKNKTSKPPNE
jgi:O-antigen ligase